MLDEDEETWSCPCGHRTEAFHWDHVAKLTREEQARIVSDSLPICADTNDGSDLISLCDIVITGVENNTAHFWIHKYDPNADGIKKSWVVLRPLPSAGTTKPDGNRIVQVELFARDVRRAVYDYLLSRLRRGMALDEARQLVDGSYTDVVVADSILQFALYGEEVYG